MEEVRSVDVFIISLSTLVLYHLVQKISTGVKRKMADIGKLYGTDSQKEIDGVWRDDIVAGSEFLIARIGNPNYQKRFNALSKPYRRAIKKGTLEEEVAEKLLIRCMAETILLGWKNVEVYGKKVNYSVENAVELLTKFKDLREEINDVANAMEIYKQEEQHEDTENLKKS